MTGLAGTAAADVAARENPLKREPLTIATAAGPPSSNKEVAFTSEVAQTIDQKAKGLMFRRSLDDQAGMLFPYDKPQEITMWMRNTYIPLDMLFIRADGTIHRIESMTEPFSEATIASQGDVVAVLELNGGAAGRLGIKAGDVVRHRAFGTGRR